LLTYVMKARKILYIVDNSGEILFDGVLIEKIKALNPQCEIFIAGKSSPMLNDVTVDELIELGFPQRCFVVSTGSNCFGVPIDEVSDEFLKILESSDVIISKGQALLEFWIEYNCSKVFNLAFTKIPILDPVLGEIPSGKHLIIQSIRYRSAGKRSYFENCC
jgi:damage-control phosphatase, subfamily I